MPKDPKLLFTLSDLGFVRSTVINQIYKKRADLALCLWPVP